VINSSSTVLLDKTISAASSCTTTVCKYTTTVVLPYGHLRWHIRSYNSSGWGEYTAYIPFTLGATTIGRNFVFYFSNDAPDWKAIKGSWLIGNGAYKTSGLYNYVASSVHPGPYSSLDFVGKVMRKSDESAANRMYFRGSANGLGSDYDWNNGYIFQYANSGYFMVIKWSMAHSHLWLLGLQRPISTPMTGMFFR
jgi:hypothetical protein